MPSPQKAVSAHRHGSHGKWLIGGKESRLTLRRRDEFLPGRQSFNLCRGRKQYFRPYKCASDFPDIGAVPTLPCPLRMRHRFRFNSKERASLVFRSSSGVRIRAWAFSQPTTI